MKKGITKTRSMKGMTRCCRAKHCRCGKKPCKLKPRIRCKPSTRKPPTLDEIKQKLDNNGRKIDANGRKINDIIKNGRKIDAILENVSDFKNSSSKKENDHDEYDEYEYSGFYSGLSSGDGPKEKSKLLSRKVDALLENMSDLKTTINNAIEGKMREANQNEDNPPTNQRTQLTKSTSRTKPAKNLSQQEIEEPDFNGSGSGDREQEEESTTEVYWIYDPLR